MMPSASALMLLALGLVAAPRGPSRSGAVPPAPPAEASVSLTPASPASVLPKPASARLLVLDLVARGVQPEVASAVNQAVQGQAVRSHFGETVTATQIRVALDAAANQQLLGCEAEACMSDLGRTVEASLVLGGTVTQVGPDLLVTLVTVNSRDGSRLGQQQRKVPVSRELYYYAARQLTSLVLTGRTEDPRVPVNIKVVNGDAPVIVIDGKESARATETTVQLDPGSHDVRVRDDGKVEWKLVLQVEDATPLSVTAQLITSRVDLWPLAIGTAAAAAVVGVVGLGFGLRAQDVYEGSVELPFPFYDVKRSSSYQYALPTTSEQLYALQQEVEQTSLAANVLYATAGTLSAAGVALLVTDIIGSASVE